MASWTLWQPLIPRYQLTTKEVPTEDINVNNRPRSSPTSPRVRGPNPNPVPQSPRNRNTRCVSGSPRKRSNADNINECDTSLLRENGSDAQQGKATMYFTMASPIQIAKNDDCGVLIKPSFPIRRSKYVDNFKQQQRINSARQSFEDPSTASPRHRTKSPRQRNTTRSVSQFPVTQIETQQDLNQYRFYNVSVREQQRPNTAVPQATPRLEKAVDPAKKRPTCKSAGPVREVKNLSVNTIHPFDNRPKPFLKNPLYKNPSSPRRYAVRKLDDATMFIDDDKIIFIKKKTTKNDVLLCQNNVDEMNYIRHLRRLYLREPKDIAKFIKEPMLKKSNVIRERLEYEMKTDHILNYYSRVDDKQDASLWAMTVEESRKNQTPCTTPRSASAPRKTESARRKQNGMTSPPRSARGRERDRRDERPVSARSLTHSNKPEGVHLNHDSLSDWNVFLKFNSQSTLHERQFYLQTPMNSVNNSKESIDKKSASCENHECRMCRLEKEMGKQTTINDKVITDTNITQSNDICDNTSKSGNAPPIANHSNAEQMKSREKVEGEQGGPNGIDTRQVTNNQSEETNKYNVRTVATSTEGMDGDEVHIIEAPTKENAQPCRISKKINVNLQISVNDTDSEKTIDADVNDTSKTHEASAIPAENTVENVSGNDQVTVEETRGCEVDGDDERGNL